MNRTVSIFILVLACLACKENIPTPQEFPVLLTLAPTDNDRSGATFRAEVAQQGLSNTSSYGFTWDFRVANGNLSNKIIVGEKLSEDYFEIRVDSGLTKGMNYHIRAFAEFEGKTVFGTEVMMQSEGSQKNKWSLVLDSTSLEGVWVPSASYSEGKGALLFRSSEFYYYKPEQNQFEQGPDFPETGFRTAIYPSTSLNGIQYLITNLNQNLYRIQNGTWQIESVVPIQINRDVRSFFFANNQSLFVLNSDKSYKYDTQSKTWSLTTDMPVDPQIRSIHGFTLDGKAYVLNSDRSIWEFNPNSETWKFISVFIDRMSGELICFAHGGKIYMGFRHGNLASITWLINKFYSYDIALDKWEEEQGFPQTLSQQMTFYFPIDDKLYVGHGNEALFDLWEFDPAFGSK